MLLNYISMKLTFWGVRGSIPVPGRETVIYGGNTSCYSIETDNHFIILDAGTGIRNLGKKIDKKVFIILFSHLHHDHHQGLPFFKWMYVPNRLINMYSPMRMNRSLMSILKTELFDSPMFPVLLNDTKSKKKIEEIGPTDSIRLLTLNPREKYFKKKLKEIFGNEWEETIKLYPAIENLHIKVPFGTQKLEGEVGVIETCENLSHPQNGTLFYKITEYKTGKRIVYATDTEPYRGGDKNLIRFARGVDILIHDSQFTEEQYLSDGYIVQGFGHSDYKSAVEVAVTAEVKHLVLTHFDPNNSDEIVAKMEEDAKRYAKELGTQLKVTAAKEGESIEI